MAEGNDSPVFMQASYRPILPMDATVRAAAEGMSMIRIWDRYWNLLGSIEQPTEWPADCILIDDAWRWQGAQHATIDLGGRRWDGRVVCLEGRTYARHIDRSEDRN